MTRTALRSWKCKAGFHQGSHIPEIHPLLRTARPRITDDETLLPPSTKGCLWRGCRCYCHPWYQKQVSITTRRIGRDTPTLSPSLASPPPPMNARNPVEREG
jgi:hypothetical protein